MARKTLRRGFTLVETVVTIGIVAALAAVVYPSVVKQFDKADPTRAAEDLNNIRTGIEAFSVNVRPEQPKDIEDLANLITNAAPDSSATGGLYTATDLANWTGPYIALSLADTISGVSIVLQTGFGGTVPNRLQLYDIDLANGGDTLATPGNGAEFIAIRVLGLSGAAFNAINGLIDGPTEATALQQRHLGRFRCPRVVAPLQTDPCADAYFLAVPKR